MIKLYYRNLKIKDMKNRKKFDWSDVFIALPMSAGLSGVIIAIGLLVEIFIAHTGFLNLDPLFSILIPFLVLWLILYLLILKLINKTK